VDPLVVTRKSAGGLGTPNASKGDQGIAGMADVQPVAVTRSAVYPLLAASLRSGLPGAAKKVITATAVEANRRERFNRSVL
jgi:hypothetical protein